MGMIPKQLAIVSALVGAGGNLGAVIAGKCFYAPIEDELLPFKIHAVYVMFWTLLSPCFYWPHLGGMFVGPKELPKEELTSPAKDYAGWWETERVFFMKQNTIGPLLRQKDL